MVIMVNMKNLVILQGDSLPGESLDFGEVSDDSGECDDFEESN